jgi:hypothetical protein
MRKGRRMFFPLSYFPLAGDFSAGKIRIIINNKEEPT